MILRFVSMRHGKPFSIRVIVIGEIFAARASSDSRPGEEANGPRDRAAGREETPDLLISRASRVFLNAFSFIRPFCFMGRAMCTYDNVLRLAFRFL